MVSPSLAYMHNNITKALFLAWPLYKATNSHIHVQQQTLTTNNNTPEMSPPTIFISRQCEQKCNNVAAQEVVGVVNKMSFKSIKRS